MYIIENLQTSTLPCFFQFFLECRLVLPHHSELSLKSSFSLAKLCRILLLPNLHPVSCLSRMCISLAPIPLSLLPFASRLSCIIYRCYTNRHRPQSQDTTQQTPLQHYFSSHAMLVHPNNSSTTHLAPRPYLYYSILRSVSSLSD